ncbi:MAG: methyltransferase [Candidatus Nanohaloarchaeota archaeon QJJ-5]|nr:methyltransferase [Candidatus Nanohaloarchaeota archaeon QJJ-5]
MNKTDVKMVLSELETFDTPDPELEQYPTPPTVAADMVNRLALDCDGDSVIDLGTGTGILAIGAALQGFSVTGYDIDASALSRATDNADHVKEQYPSIDVSFEHSPIDAITATADAVIMNPPFGIQQTDANTAFLSTAFETAPLVYALLHQSRSSPAETRKFIKEYALQHSFEARIVADYELDLPRSMAFHDNDQYTIRADLYRFTR